MKINFTFSLWMVLLSRLFLCQQVPPAVTTQMYRKEAYAHQVSVCRGHMRSITCPNLELLHIYNAFYGKLSGHDCEVPITQFRDQMPTCFSKDAPNIIRQSCQGQQSCDLYAEDSLYSNPCPLVKKYLFVSFTCQGKSRLPEILKLFQRQQAQRRQHLIQQQAIAKQQIKQKAADKEERQKVQHERRQQQERERQQRLQSKDMMPQFILGQKRIMQASPLIRGKVPQPPMIYQSPVPPPPRTWQQQLLQTTKSHIISLPHGKYPNDAIVSHPPKAQVQYSQSSQMQFTPRAQVRYTQAAPPKAKYTPPLQYRQPPQVKYTPQAQTNYAQRARLQYNQRAQARYPPPIKIRFAPRPPLQYNARPSARYAPAPPPAPRYRPPVQVRAGAPVKFNPRTQTRYPQVNRQQAAFKAQPVKYIPPVKYTSIHQQMVPVAQPPANSMPRNVWQAKSDIRYYQDQVNSALNSLYTMYTNRKCDRCDGNCRNYLCYGCGGCSEPPRAEQTYYYPYQRQDAAHKQTHIPASMHTNPMRTAIKAAIPLTKASHAPAHYKNTNPAWRKSSYTQTKSSIFPTTLNQANTLIDAWDDEVGNQTSSIMPAEGEWNARIMEGPAPWDAQAAYEQFQSDIAEAGTESQVPAGRTMWPIAGRMLEPPKRAEGPVLPPPYNDALRQRASWSVNLKENNLEQPEDWSLQPDKPFERPSAQDTEPGTEYHDAFLNNAMALSGLVLYPFPRKVRRRIIPRKRRKHKVEADGESERSTLDRFREILGLEKMSSISNKIKKRKDKKTRIRREVEDEFRREIEEEVFPGFDFMYEIT